MEPSQLPAPTGDSCSPVQAHSLPVLRTEIPAWPPKDEEYGSAAQGRLGA